MAWQRRMKRPPADDEVSMITLGITPEQYCEVEDILAFMWDEDQSDLFVVVDRVMDPDSLGLDLDDIPDWLDDAAQDAYARQVGYLWLQVHK